jgi:hypothetical protein
MQRPLEDLSENARRVHAFLAQDPDRSETLYVIAESVGLGVDEAANALRELAGAQRAKETSPPGGWLLKSA